MAALVLAIAMVCVVSPAPAAQAVVCGKKPTRKGKRATGALALRQKESKLIQDFGRDTATESLALIFTVSGCRLPSGAPARKLAVEFLPLRGVDHQLKSEAFVGTIKPRRSSPNTLQLVIPVNPKKFKPGSYGALAQITAPYLAITRTPIGASRSENKVSIPVFVGIVGGLAGLLLSLLTKVVSGSHVQTRGWRFWVVVAFALGAGGAAGWSVYHDQDIWRLSENWLVTFLAGVTSATTGAVVALLGLVVVDRTINADPGGPANAGGTTAAEPNGGGPPGGGPATSPSGAPSGRRVDVVVHLQGEGTALRAGDRVVATFEDGDQLVARRDGGGWRSHHEPSDDGGSGQAYGTFEALCIAEAEAHLDDDPREMCDEFAVAHQAGRARMARR
jgi:hypothetical protein